jgi:hypothetical protein
VLHQVADLPQSGAPIGVEYRQLTLELEILAEREVPHDACDAVHGQAHLILYALGLDIVPGAVQWDYDDENPALGICRAQYAITYRRMEGEL